LQFGHEFILTVYARLTSIERRSYTGVLLRI